jgi:pyruvate formate-lyase activating enzyme-like uncharacterized protein
MAKVVIPSRPETKEIRGFTPLKPHSTITSRNGNKFTISSAGGVFVNKEGINDLEIREKNWQHYANTTDKNVKQYNEHVIKRNRSIEESIDKATNPWWKLW